MKLCTPFPVQPNFLSTFALVIAWLVSGCSGSSDSVATDGQSSINPLASEASDIDGNGNPDENIDFIEAESDTEIADPEINPEITLEDEANETVINNPVGNPVVVDPMIQNRIPVTFEITVPFYLSDELQVELIWGEINITAMWVGGQLWSATGEFPTETEHLLEITFYDNNGAVELARYSQNYRVGSNASEAVQIPAEQFDANQFDGDGDGVNNLAELNAGTDPFVNEDSLLEISDTFALIDSRGQYSRRSASQLFESFVQQDRPYVDAYEIERGLNATLFGQISINIDAFGNGTLDVNSNEIGGRFIPMLSATRTNSGSSISWTGEITTSDDDYFHRENITNTVSVVDENLRSFIRENNGSNSGTFEFSWESSANLTGRLIEGSSLCEPVAGTFTDTRQNNFDFPNVVTTVTTVSKEIDDPYWRVVIADNDSETIEYFARGLEIVNDPDNDESAFFICDFVDI